MHNRHVICAIYVINLLLLLSLLLLLLLLLSLFSFKGTLSLFHRATYA